MTSATYLVTSVDGVATGLLLFTVAAGLMLIFGTMDVLNLAHGSLYLAGAYLAWALTDGSLFSLALALIVGVALGAAGGGLLEVLLRPGFGRELGDRMSMTFGTAEHRRILVVASSEPISAVEHGGVTRYGGNRQ